MLLKYVPFKEQMLHLLMYSLFPQALENIYPLKFYYSYDDQDL